MKIINVTKTFMPPIEEYEDYLERIWESGQLTNQGPILKEFESKTQDYLGVSNFHLLSNGTVALQLALRALNITSGEIITTPFSYVATTSSILWERCEPVFVDIETDSFCIDAEKIEAAITSRTKAIMAVHVFGIPCDIEKISEIATKHNLKVIYDGAHAFGAVYKGKSLLSYGDISTCSFHATKLFHTIEGGAIITNSKSVSEKVELLKRFGHNDDDHLTLGINGKATEFQAAMGLCNLKYIDEIISKRRALSQLYDKQLKGKFESNIPTNDHIQHNYAYYPLIFVYETELLLAIQRLNAQNVYPRRYFYPSLNLLPYLNNKQACPVSEDIANRVLCLPLYYDLEEESIKRICRILLGETS